MTKTILIFSLLCCCIKATAVGIIPEKNEGINVFANLEESGNYTDQLSIAELNNLPMGISKHINTVEYTIAINEFEIYPDHARISVYGKVKIPQLEDGERKDKILIFGSKDIKLSFEGNIIGEAKLQLLGDFSIPIFGNNGELILRGGDVANTTYMQMDCNGFKELGINADIVFSEEVINKVDDVGNPIEGPLGRVSANFFTKIRDWNDILCGINIPRFAINGFDGFIFDVKNAVFDFSDSNNHPLAQLPTRYISDYLSGPIELWKGVFVSELMVTLPKQFSKNGSETRVSFSSKNLIIDNNGLSGNFMAEDLFSIEEGNAGGWRFSVDKFGIELEANQLVGAGFSGQIGLPVSSQSNLAYDAFITPDNEYFLKVNPVNEIDFNLWAAKGTLLPTSYVELKVMNNKFLPEAVLYGHINIAAKASKDSDSKLAELNGIQFRKLHLRTEDPYISVESFGYNGTVSLKGFPLSISKISLTTINSQASLEFDAKLSLGDEKTGIVADTRLAIVGSMRKTNLFSWEYEKIAVSDLQIKATMAEVFSLNGSLSLMNNDPVYGDGFAGNIQLKLDMFENVEAGVKAIFGKKEFKYWCVEGYAAFGKGIPMFPPINLTGLGGGAYYKMSPVASGPSGVNYAPNADVALGLKAAVRFNGSNDKLINGEALFEIAFNNNGGINFIGFFGQAKFLGDIAGSKDIQKFVKDKYAGIVDKEKAYMKSVSGMQTLEKLKIAQPNKAAENVFPTEEKPGDAGFIAKVGIQYDFSKKALHSTFDLYVNVLGGMIQGRSSGGRAGWAVLHVEKNDWYLHMGRPDDRLGLKMNLAGLIKMETGGYFMMGSQIPGSPPPPAQVANILGLDAERLNYMRDLNALGNGKGIAFGSDFLVSTGDITFLILYANFQTGLGFDLMLKDYEDAQCKGRSGVIGIDGWYANGQAYAFLQGEVGVKVNLLFIKKRIPIIKGAAATLMQAKLPNPSWFAGYLGVKFDLLGGLVSGNMRLKIALGEECELVIPGGSPLGVKVISDLSPEDNSDQVDVFAVPQAVFNMPVEKVFEMDDDEGTKLYRLKLDQFQVNHNGQLLEGSWKFNSQKDAALFYSKEVLPPNSSLKAKVRIVFEEYKNNRWLSVSTGGKQAEEVQEISFKTGEAPKVIPLHNIEYCYPVKDQKYFFPKETNKGYVQLKRGQSYLFSDEMKHQVILAGNNIDFKYNVAQNRIEYTLPDLANSSNHYFEVVSYMKASGNTVSNSANRVSIGDKENEITIKDSKASEVVRDDVGQVLLEYGFASSAYTTFADKMKGLQKNQALVWRNENEDIYLEYSVKNGEFDIEELAGTDFTGNSPLISPTALLDDDFFIASVNPLIYKGYPFNGVRIVNRDTDVYGIPPIKALPVRTDYLSETEFNVLSPKTASYFPYTYNLFGVYKADFFDLRQQATTMYLNGKSVKELESLIKGSFPALKQGTYNIKLQYMLPGGVKGTSYNFDYYNALR